jgi:hypothetical protein
MLVSLFFFFIIFIKKDSEVLRDAWVLTSNVKVSRWLRMAKEIRLIEVSL